MTLRLFALWFLLLSLLSAGALQWWQREQAKAQFQQLASLLRPGLLLRYQSLPLWPPALPLVYHNLSLEPAGDYQTALEAPIGYQGRVRQAVIHGLSLDAAGQLEEVQIELRGVELPWLPARPAFLAQPEAVLGGAWPDSASLQWPRLDFDADLRLRYVAARQELSVQISAQAAQRGELQASLLVQATPEQVRRAEFSAMPFVSLRAEYRDRGLLQQVKETLAVRERMSPEGWEQATLARLEQVSREGGWNWDAASAQAVQLFIRQPQQASLRLEPLSPVLPRNIGLYKPGDWPALFGLQFSTAGSVAAPGPGRAAP